MHDEGNIRYANYQSEAQMTDYLTTQGHESDCLGSYCWIR